MNSRKGRYGEDVSDFFSLFRDVFLFILKIRRETFSLVWHPVLCHFEFTRNLARGRMSRSSTWQIRLVMICRQRLSDVERGKCHEDICLEKCHEKLEEPKWKCEDTKCSCVECWDLFSDIDDDTDEDRTDEDIEEETHREWTDTDELSDEVKPSNEYSYEFLSCRVSMIVPEIVREMIDWTLEVKSSKLCDEDNREREDESRREIRVNRTEVVTEPFVFRDESKPVEYKTDEISKKYHDDESTEEPEVVFRDLLIPEEIFRVHIDTVDDIESKCTKTWKFFCTNSYVHKCNEYEKYSHKNPCREYRIGNMESADLPSMDDITLWRWDMWTFMLSGFMCRSSFSMNGCCHSFICNFFDDAICYIFWICCYSCAFYEAKCRDCEKWNKNETKKCTHRKNIEREYRKKWFFCKFFFSFDFC